MASGDGACVGDDAAGATGGIVGFGDGFLDFLKKSFLKKLMTISRFRRRLLRSMMALLMEVMQLCRDGPLVSIS